MPSPARIIQHAAGQRDKVSLTGGYNGFCLTRIVTKEKYGKASNELFMQFVSRIALEMPKATIGMFSTMKYINAPTLDEFRENWKANFIGGFVVHSKIFDGLKGNFPIGFLIWKTNQNAKSKVSFTEISVGVLDKNAHEIGDKSFYNLPNNQLLTNWVERPKTNSIQVVPLKNAVIPASFSKDLRGTKWADDALAWLNCAGNDLQQANLTFLISSGFGSGRGFFVTSKNLWQAAVVISARRLIKKTWVNDRDQFLQPNRDLSTEFLNDVANTGYVRSK